MIGQESLISKLKLKSIDNLSQSILLLGPSGCGKHTLANEISEYYGFPLLDITENLTLDYITNIYLSASPTFYLIDTSHITEKQQNVILKLLEEPVKTTYLILLSENRASILNTIANRCVSYEFESYLPEQLAQFVTDESHTVEIINVCKTPGQVKSLNYSMLTSLINTCDNIITRLNKSISLSVALRISEKFNYKEDYDKFDIDIFFNVLSEKLTQDYIKNMNDHSLKLYNILDKYKKKMRDTRVNRKNLIDSMIMEMWVA